MLFRPNIAVMSTATKQPYADFTRTAFVTPLLVTYRAQEKLGRGSLFCCFGWAKSTTALAGPAIAVVRAVSHVCHVY